MRPVYFSLEALGALIILILLYANIFEIKQKSKKIHIFSVMLILNLVVVCADAVTWLDLGWKNMQGIFSFLVTLTYVLPLLIQASFSRYVYEHISEKVDTNKKPFLILLGYSLIAFVLTLVLCLARKFFYIEDGIWHSGSMEWLYFLVYLLPFLYIILLVLINEKKLGLHDSIASLSFCFFPLVSIGVSFFGINFNPAIPLMAVDLLVIFILLHSDTENRLLYESFNDKLTGLYNRRAYEDDLLNYPEVPAESDFIYASIDINGLKQINDTLGHAAGDELICGASDVLKKTFCSYGKVFRTGGDEFVAMFFTDDDHLNLLLEDVKKLCYEWKGNLVDELSLSVGVATKRQFQTQTVKEISKIADQRMYEDKARYYASRGVDRRGQNEAHKMICSLYTKIIKINISEDSYSVINMGPDEQTYERGFSEKISEWLEGFGKNGFVHPDDLENYLEKTNLEYMKNYFGSGKSSLLIQYRRKYNDGFKQVLMEFIPTKDYSPQNQTLFLYVKNIDR